MPEIDAPLTSDEDHDDDRDRIHSGAAPFLVLDNQGKGWSAQPHGSLTPIERPFTREPWEEPFDSDHLVRLGKRAIGTVHLALLTIDGARALGNQLLIAADVAEQGSNVEAVTNSIDAEAQRLLKANASQKVNFGEATEDLPARDEDYPDRPLKMEEVMEFWKAGLDVQGRGSTESSPGNATLRRQMAEKRANL